MNTSPSPKSPNAIVDTLKRLSGFCLIGMLFVFAFQYDNKTIALMTMPDIRATRTVPTAAYRLYTWDKGLQLIIVADGPTMQETCARPIIDQQKVYQCQLRFADGTLVTSTIWEESDRSRQFAWVEMNGKRYSIAGRGYVMRIRAAGAQTEITRFQRTFPVFPPGAEASTLEAWLATDPEFASIAAAFAKQ
ncbi:hypothetical protein [Herpetosiphon geysericola]|uniref:Uncharacterized protein n=1 Tax=Herpetosiphon geysericola TaxID=70996 RepID=A0A0P6Y5C5_9CHLR|nr:hypothetical protein [Herpetosiphon geysericola]KPL91461.1 hypothetical protein SE18_02085 [Herpetosiphon geysericola]